MLPYKTETIFSLSQL